MASLAPTLRRLVLLRQSATADAAHRIAVLIMQCRGLQVSLNPTAPRVLEGRFLLNTPSCCRQRQSSVTDPPGRFVSAAVTTNLGACSRGRLERLLSWQAWPWHAWPLLTLVRRTSASLNRDV